jgi:serine/threonine-protein kinase
VGGAVHHANVVAVSDAGLAADGTPFLVMELVRGVPLDELVHREGPFTLRRATAVVGQILAGLQALHDAGFVHGDVKSGNVLIDADPGADRVKLIDLGLARTADAPDPPGARIASGTPEYMAPEVVLGHGASPRSDVYGAGVVLYQLLTGTTPFEGGPSREILRRQLDDAVVPPSLRCPDRTIPPALEAAVMIALAKEPSARHASAAAFAAVIAAATPSDEPPVSRGEPRQVFSTDAPTLEWLPQELPASPVAVAGARPPAAAARGGRARQRSRPPHRGTLAPCRRSAAIYGPWALSTRRPR